jgi:hydrogenase expression/formation protein HypC
VSEAETGDYVIVHTGFAISRLDEAEAQETLALMEESGILVAEPNT